jgi:hypothetical protein
MRASDKLLRNAKATPLPALAIISTTTLGAAAPRSPNAAAPKAPPRNIRFMPNRSPRTPAPRTEAARVSVARDETKMVVPGENCRPLRMTEMLVATILRSPRVTALPRPMATVVMVAANPLSDAGGAIMVGTCSCRRTTRW